MTPRFFLFPAALVALLFGIALGADRIAAEPGAQIPLLGFAVGCGAWLIWLWRGHVSGARPLRLDFLARPSHYMQIVAHTSVYTYWGTAFPEVRAHIPHLASQIALLYLLDMALSFTRRGRWRLSFGPFPIIFSTNLFLWFLDAYYGLQWAMILVSCLLKEYFRRPEPDGSGTRHWLNPSAAGLSLFSYALIALQLTHLTYGEQIAVTMEKPTYAFEWIFGVGLIVQLLFAPVLITASAALTTVACGAIHHALTGDYMFQDEAIPVNVYLGMTLLVTDPATSPSSRVGKILFGAAYGASVFGLYPLLLAIGAAQNPAAPIALTYFDKLLQVPILNLLVPTFDRIGRRLDPKPDARGRAERRQNLLHVCLWIGAFLAIRPLLVDHPGRQPAFWADLCAKKGGRACTRSADLLTEACLEKHRAASCRPLGELHREGRGVPRNLERAGQTFAHGCELGDAPSCTALAELLLAGGEGVPARPDMAGLLFQRACAGGDASACGR